MVEKQSNSYSLSNNVHVNNYPSMEGYNFAEVTFQNLMVQRIINVLLICSHYDAYMLEEDGRINERIFLEYKDYNLRYPPRFSHASSSEMALKMLKENEYDLVITMLNVGKIDAFDMAKKVKEKFDNIPVVVLTHFSREVSLKLSTEDLSSIDNVFCWLGNTSLLTAIIKLMEDRMNADYDVTEIGVQAILLVEDSIRYYSSYLPEIYKSILEQSMELMSEGLNEHQKTLRMRARPKILLAKSYEEAVELYESYKDRLLGIITDNSYKRSGKTDRNAGIKLAEFVRDENKTIPILIQSSSEWDESLNHKLNITFVNKYSKRLLVDLKKYILDHYGFGDFVFKDPVDENEIARAKNLHDFQSKIMQVPSASLLWHGTQNHFSIWLKARALFALANFFAPIKLDDFTDLEKMRSYMVKAITTYRRTKGRGVIASYIDEYAIFTRLGNGMLGGKARGLAFIDLFIKKLKLMNKWSNTIVSIPRTFVLSTDIFDEFMEINKLYKFALSDVSDEEIVSVFSTALLPSSAKRYIKVICQEIKTPIAVRSSSLLEDSHFQPFAGVYSTFMLANNHPTRETRQYQLEQAVKSVYASVFFKESKAYISATSNVIDEEKMGVIIQEISGKQYGDRYYPTISGVAQSMNFYPIEPESSEDGIVKVAFGFGKTIVEGGVGIRFCPKYPKKILQLSQPEYALRDTQKEYYALDLDPVKFHSSTDETVTLNKLKVRTAEKDSSIKYVASTFDYQDKILRDGVHEGGKKLITFSNILKHEMFPLADIIKTLLDIGKREMNNQVEIEFAVNLDVPRGEPNIFNFLQIRPIVEEDNRNQVEIEDFSKDEIIVASDLALGNGVVNDVYDIVYVRPEAFDPADTKLIAKAVDELNTKFIHENKNYILIGPGRWGSTDPWLGVPVKWAQISAARLIIESGLKNFQIDPSQGTHFFQNLTSFNVGYFTINPFNNDGMYDIEFLNSKDSVYEDKYLRHVRFDNPAVIMIDGKKKKGIIYKPEA